MSPTPLEAPAPAVLPASTRTEGEAPASAPNAPSSAGSRTKPQSLREAAPALIALCLTMLVEMVDNSVLNVALPSIGRSLDATATQLQWIVGAYSLTFGGLLLVGGTLGDKLGRRRTLLWGLALFGAAGLAVLLVASPWQLIAVRAVSGAFAAMIAPLSMSLIFRLFDSDKLRGQAIGIIVTVGMAGFAVGPVLAGLAVEHMPWQVLLVANAPVAAIAFFGVKRGIQADDPAELRTGGTDVTGALLSVAALGLLLASLTFGAEHGWTDVRTVAAVVAGLAALAGFVWRERTAADPMLNLDLLALRTVRGSALLQTSVMMAMVAVMFGGTQIFQFAWGWAPWQAGLANLPTIVGMLLAGPLTDGLVERLGHRRTAVVGSVFVLAALALWILAISQGFLLAAAAMLIMSLGVRVIMTTGSVALIDALPEDHTSLGSALNDTTQEIGNAIGVAVVGTVMAALFGSAMPQGRWDAATVHSFIHAQQVAFWIIGGIVLALMVMGVRTLTDSKATEEH